MTDRTSSDGGAAASRGTARRQAAARRANLMKYASDNRVVQAFYSIVGGPYRHVFYAAVVVAVLVGLYGPLGDLYAARRTSEILQKQQAIGESYAEELQGEVDQLLSKEGIEGAAREQGIVKPGEQPITVEGLSEDDGAGEDGASGSAPATSTEVEKAQQEVLSETTWYYKILDAIFGYTGPVGQKLPSDDE